MNKKVQKSFRNIIKLLGLPILVVWPEIVMHWAMSMSFTTIWVFFAIAFGALLNALGHLWGKKISLKVSRIL